MAVSALPQLRRSSQRRCAGQYHHLHSAVVRLKCGWKRDSADHAKPPKLQDINILGNILKRNVLLPENPSPTEILLHLVQRLSVMHKRNEYELKLKGLEKCLMTLSLSSTDEIFGGMFSTYLFAAGSACSSSRPVGG